MGAHSGWHCHRPPHAPCHPFQVTSCGRRWHGGVTVTPAPQVLPPAEVLPLQHRRVQPVPAGRRRQLPLQQTPEGDRPPDPPQPWGGGRGAGAMPRGRSGSPCHSHGAAIKPGVPSGDRARPSWAMVGGGVLPCPGGTMLFFGGLVVAAGLGPPQQLSLPSPSVPAALGPSGVRQRLRGGGRGVRLRLAGGERGPGTVPGPCRVVVGSPRPLSPQECAKSGGNCCKKCTLTHDAMCSDGLCCKGCKVGARGCPSRCAVRAEPASSRRGARAGGS